MNVCREMLTPAGMASAHAALIARHEWFLHVKEVKRFNEIIAQGLQPRKQDYLPNKTSEMVLAALGQHAEKIICLRPLGTFDSTPRRDNAMALFAIDRFALSKTLSLDWTYDGNWSLVPILKRDHPEWTNEEIFCEIVRRRGSVVVYDPIPATDLRVWISGTSRDHPSSWPLAVNVDENAVKRLGK